MIKVRVKKEGDVKYQTVVEDQAAADAYVANFRDKWKGSPEDYVVEFEDLSQNSEYVAQQRKDRVRRDLDTAGFTLQEMVDILWDAIAENDRTKLNEVRQQILDIRNQP
jgi:hypothetical protein